MASTDPTAAYRAQQGMAPITQSSDPKVVGWIVQAAKATGADPRALLATAIQESGARTGAIGDQGTSFGPFQMHRGGALGTHNAAWANSYDAVLNRAQEFAKDQVHHGIGAAAVQRPADRALYARGVDSHYQQASAILAKFGLAPPATPPVTAAPKAAVATAPITTADHAAIGTSLLQSIIDQNAKLAGISSFTIPTQPAIQTVQQPQTAATAAPRKANPAQGIPGGKVAVGQFKIIGTPGQGTHAVAFNRAGGSDNWESERAVDIAMPTGTPIYAPTSGIIGSQIGSLGSGGRFAGLRVHLNGGGNEFYFAHLSRLTVQAGQKVQRGQIIGYSGAANGVQHLHLATKAGNPGRYA